MAQAVAFGSITLTDITDLGEFSVQPMSNLPLTVVYDPNQDSYTPDWGSSTLTITPAIYYAGRALTLGSTGLTVTWQKQLGIGAITDISSASGETVSGGGILNVSRNQFAASTLMVTYIVTATYSEQSLGTTLTAKGQITFALVRHASNLKNIEIIGESIFKYNTSQTLVGATSITLTANPTNVEITAWQYQNASGNWVTYPNSGTSTTLTVNATDSVFTNDKCIIRVTTNDNAVFDLHTIAKLRDGAAGSETVSAVLTNDDQMVPFDKTGTGDFSAATSQIIVYEGGQDVTASWTISSSWDSSLTATRSTTTSNNDTISVTGMTGATGNVTFTCTKSGYNSITKTFSLVKVESGADGVTPTVYSLEASALALNKDTSNVFNPSSVTFYAYQQTGGNNKTSYNGRFKIFENISLEEYTAASPKPSAKYTSNSNESSYNYTPSTSATSILCILYAAGATTTQLDSQQVVVTSDGQKGDEGPQGSSGVTIILGNYADVLSCSNANTLLTQHTITIPFSAYEGTTRIPCSVSAPQLLGVNPTVTSATTTSDGSIVWTLPSGTSVTSANGVLSMTFTAQATGGNVQIVENYSWSRNTAATNGLNNATVTLYKRGTSAPSKPSGTVTYTFASGAASGSLGGWTQAIPSGTDPVWAIYATASSTGTTDTISSGEWSTQLKVLENGTDGDAGYNQATIFLYQRSATAPSAPSASTTYTFATGALNTVPSGWSRTIPANDGTPCWVTTAVAVSQDASTTIASSAWSTVVKLAEDGTNSVLLQIFTPTGTNIVTDTVTSVTLQATLLDGAIDVTSDSTIVWEWSKFQNGAYTPISGAGSSSYVVSGSTVDSYASFRCKATYANNDYYAYFSVFDKTDPIQITVLSSIGTQIINGQGVGAIYVKVSRNGQEIDAMKSERFLTANPTSAKSGDYYYKLDEANKTVKLMKYTSSWAESSETYDGTYTWSWRDKDGNVVTAVNGYALPTNGKVVYIDGEMIDDKIVADVEVRI